MSCVFPQRASMGEFVAHKLFVGLKLVFKQDMVTTKFKAKHKMESLESKPHQ